MVRSLVDEDNSTGLRKAAREQWLERLRVICEGGKKTVVGVECVPPTLAGELATPTGNDHPPGALSAGEFEVLKCIAEGYSTKETAVRLGIAFKTAACHRSNIMDKLGTH